jgi:hypothetical protein
VLGLTRGEAEVLRDGRGAKMIYSGDHLFKLVTAFELIGIGLPAQAATQLVTRHWPELSAAYALAQVNKYRGVKAGRVYAQLKLKSLHELQFAKYLKPQASSVIIQDHEAFTRFMESRGEHESTYGLIVLLITDTLQRVGQVAEDVAGVENAGTHGKF